MLKEPPNEALKYLAKEFWHALRSAKETYLDLSDGAEGAPPTPQPDHLRPGADVGRDGHTTFVLFAPGKQAVALAGTFNDWSPEPMADAGEGLWWTERRLPQGRHAYQFVVDGNIWICDPYAREVQWDERGPKAITEVGKEPYTWNDGDFHPRPLHDLIIYEAHVGDFSPEGTFEGMRQRLDYIKELGVTAIELMPVMEFPMDRSWGYNPSFFFAPEHAYGTADDLKRLIDDAHQRGIAIILDVVFNHTQQDNPLNLMWPYDQNPYFSGSNPWGMPDFNHFADMTKAYIRDVQDFWLTEYHIDGFRYDATAYIESDVMSGIGFFTWAARQTKPEVYLIAEHLPQDPYWIHNTELDAQWHDTFHDVMKAQLREGNFEGGQQWGDLDAVERSLHYALDGFSHPREVVNYTASHDEQRVVHETLSNPWLNDEIAYRKAKLGMLTVITAAGVPMLYAGEETGMNKPRTTDEAKFEWNRLQSVPEAQDLHQHWQRLTWLRNTHPALRAPNFQTLTKWGEQKAISFQRWNDEGDAIVVLLNFSNEKYHLPVSFPSGGTWWEYLYNFPIETGDDNTVTLEIPPSGGLIFCKWKNWD
ncbi:MAG TPA: alpha-amylase family glycosyl hydrolase [Ardenticatenaceae bacterium]